jgi:hypothetical protein
MGKYGPNQFMKAQQGKGDSADRPHDVSPAWVGIYYPVGEDKGMQIG